jgi:hypothetical protein
MTTTSVREQLHKYIDSLPDDMVQQISDFVLFVMARRSISSTYVDWDNDQWQTFVLEQFFREEDEVEYTLEDAQEVYRS